MTFSERLQALRADKNVSQETLAEAISVSRQAVAKWELGKACPDLEKLLQLSDYFGIGVDNLIRESAYAYLPRHDSEDALREKLTDFLLAAKKATYAGKGPEEENSCRPSSHDLVYSDGALRYFDTFLGREQFAGEEAVWEDNTPLWSMNYIGRVTGKGFSGDFLKEALLAVTRDRPFRGPRLCHRGEYTYHCGVSGDFNWFHGQEEIFASGVMVYECLFHGGKVL